MSRYRQSMAEALEQVREANQKPYVSMSSGGQYNVLDKDGKTAYSTKDKTLAYDYFKKNYDNLKEQDDKDHEISMARGELEAIVDKATQLASALQGKSDEGNPLEAWVQSKITKAKDYINSVSDYMMYKPEEVEEATYGWTLVSKAKDLAKKFKDNITKAVAEIEKLEKGLSKNPTVDAELRKYNENLEEKYTVVITKKDGTTMELGKYNTSAEAQRYVDQYGKGAKVKKEEIEIEEGKMSDIDALVKDGKSSEEIAKLMKLPVKTVKDILGEEKEVPKGYHRMPDGTIMKDSEHKKEETEKDSKEDSAKEIAALKDQINILKTKLENEKNRAVKPEPNPKTGEVPLTIGIAAAEFKKDKEKKEEVSEKTMSDRDKRIQRAKDMIKYYDAQKKAALKGKNKDLAKKMLKNDINEATVVSDISGISIPALKRETAKFNIKVARVTPGGPNGAEYEVTFTGAEKDLVAYAKEHFGFDDKPGSFQQLKKHLNMDYVPEEMKKDDAYAIGMAQAKKSMNDEPPLDKKTITKGHEIAKSILKKEEVNEVSDKLKLKVLQKKIKQYKDKVFKKTMSTVKSPLFAGVEEALEIKEFTSQMIDRLKKSFSTAPKRISPEQANALSRHLDRIELNDLRKLVKANIPFVSTVARNKIYKKTGKFEETNLEEKRLYVEAIAGLQKKADKSGMSYSILKQVYDRGMAAWKSGHRPGASQQQWAFARVNSFITKSSGTWGGADKDLAAKVKGEK